MGLSFQWWPTRPSSDSYAARVKSSGVLVSSYCCSIYRIADPFSSLDTFSSSSIGGPVVHPIADCEHPFLCLLEVYLGPFSKILLVYTMVSAFGSWLWDWSPDMAVSRWSIILSQVQTLSLNSLHGCFVSNSKKGQVSTLWSPFFLSFMCFASCILYLGYSKFLG